MPRFFLPVTAVRVWVMKFSLDGSPIGTPIVAQEDHFIQLLIGREAELRQKKETSERKRGFTGGLNEGIQWLSTIQCLSTT